MLAALKSMPTTACFGALGKFIPTASTGTVDSRNVDSVVSVPNNRSSGLCRPMPITNIDAPRRFASSANTRGGDPTFTSLAADGLPWVCAAWPSRIAVTHTRMVSSGISVAIRVAS